MSRISVSSSFAFPLPRSTSRHAFIAVLLFAISGAQAQSQKPLLSDTYAVTASRSAQPITDVLADVTVIDAATIARAGAQSLAELVQRQPGVEITMNGGPGSLSGVFLRGANRGQTLILVDGVRLSSSSAGATSLEAIPLDQVDRIEILRGPSSSLYGADAIGGVIQVFTRRGTSTLTGNASVGGGTYGTWDVKAGVTGTSGPATFAVQGAAKGSTGFNAVVDPSSFLYNNDKDGYKNPSVSASLGYTWATGQEITGQFFRSHLNSQFDGTAGSDDRTITDAETWQVASRNVLAPFWVSRLSAGAGIDDSKTESAFDDFPFKTIQRQYTWQNELTLPLGMLTAGFERREEQLKTTALFAVTERDTNSIFGIYQLRVDDHALQGNLRHDDSNQYGGKTTGSIAYGYRFSQALRVTAGYATGFKAPSFNDLYYPGFSNPDVKPETSKNFEGGIYWNGTLATAIIELRAIAYRNRVSQLIIFQCDADFNCAPQNVNRATLEGVTLGLEARADNGATVTASLDIQSPKDDVTGKLLPRRARRHGAITTGYPVGPVRFGAELIASSLRYEDPANLVKMGGYAVVNLTAEWMVAPGWTLFARADNIFDKNYELAAGFGTGGATVFAGVRAVLR
jgi:vitamin B12 transporter